MKGGESMSEEKAESECYCVVICDDTGGKGVKILKCDSPEAKELLAKIRESCGDTDCCA